MHGLAVGVLVLTDAGQCGVVEGGRGQVVLGTPGDILVGKNRGNSKKNTYLFNRLLKARTLFRVIKQKPSYLVNCDSNLKYHTMGVTVRWRIVKWDLVKGMLLVRFSSKRKGLSKMIGILYSYLGVS